jgi:hypothetical protein
LTCVHELLDLCPELLSWCIPDKAACGGEDVPIAQAADLGFDLLGSSSQTRSKPFGIEHRIRIAMEEHEDVPREK